jgi:hypothetical protein
MGSWENGLWVGVRVSDARWRTRLEFFKGGAFSIEKLRQIFSDDPGPGMWLEKVG